MRVRVLCDLPDWNLLVGDEVEAISPNGSGCTYDIEFEVSEKVPLIRKKLEEFVAKTTMEGMRDEHDYNQRELNAAG